MELEEALRGPKAGEGAPPVDPELVKIYQLYVETTDRVSTRRQRANSFFLTINTGIVAFIGYVQLGDSLLGGGAAPTPVASHLFLVPIALAGMVLCFLWHRLIRSYRGINRAKFQVIHEIEKLLPVRPFDAEWAALRAGEDPSLYLPLTTIEVTVPWVFFALHLVVLVGGVLL